MMTDLAARYPLLTQLFLRHHGDLSRLGWADEQPFILQDAESLLSELQAVSVVGLEKLAIDSSGSKSKFFALVAELRFASLFNRLGASVEVLLDESFGPGVYTPDLLVRFGHELEILVDVVWGSEGTPPIFTRLSRRLEGTKLSYWVDYALSGGLSTPKASGRAREAGEAIADSIAERVHSVLEAAHVEGEEFGLIHLYGSPRDLRVEVEHVDQRPYDSQKTQERDWLGTFGFRSAPDDEPSVGGGVNHPHWVDSDDQGDSLVRKLRDKAKKRKKLPPHYAATPFVVAIENNEFDLRPLTVLSRLTGARHWHGIETGIVSELSNDIRRLISPDWSPLLLEWDYEGTPGMAMADHGEFHTARDGWAGELSGVLISQYGTTIQCLPNPFARSEINEPFLLKIGLSADKEGQPWPKIGSCEGFWGR